MTQIARRKLPSAPRGAAAQPAMIACIRAAALACRATARAQLPTLDQSDDLSGSEAIARTLVRALPVMLTRRPVFHAPGTAARSFDEDWLLALSDALARLDIDSVRFLTRRRVRPEAAHILHVCLRRLRSSLAADKRAPF